MTRRDWLGLIGTCLAMGWLFWAVVAAHGQTPHDRFHYVYEGWLTAAGGSSQPQDTTK